MRLSHVITQLIFSRKRSPFWCLAPLTTIHMAPEFWPIIRVCAVMMPSEVVPPSESFVLASRNRTFEYVVVGLGLVGDGADYFGRWCVGR
jgi:hypothetical protein